MREKKLQIRLKRTKSLVMFAGVAPFSIVIGKNSKAKKIILMR